METVKNIRNIKVKGQEQENPVDDMKKKIEEHSGKYDKLLSEIRKKFFDNDLGPIEQFRMANELHALALEDFAHNIGTFIDKKVGDKK